MTDTVRCVAIVAVRNEAFHIQRMLRSLVKQGIDVVLIDNASTDGSADMAKPFLGRGLLSIEYLLWRGVFDLTAQLAAKEAITKKVPHDWIIHMDADEWLLSPKSGETLLDGINRVSAEGYNAIDFEEFVFLPSDRAEPYPTDCDRAHLAYYYFAPCECRLMRAWKRNEDFRNVEEAGHKLTGGSIRLAPETFILRHYIVVSYQHALVKYIDRKFPIAEIEKGWHSNRLDFSKEDLSLPNANLLKRLTSWDSNQYDRSDPKRTHFWEW